MHMSHSLRGGARLSLCLVALTTAFAANAAGPTIYSKLELTPKVFEKSRMLDRLSAYNAFKVNIPALKQQLAGAQEIENRAFAKPIRIELPAPDGSVKHFDIYEQSIMSPEVQKMNMDKRTYTGNCVENPSDLIFCDMTPLGFRAMVRGAGDPWFVDPVVMGDPTMSVAYFKHDLTPIGMFKCDVNEFTPDMSGTEFTPSPSTGYVPMAIGGNLKTYRLALMATGEYCNYFGSTTSTGPTAAVSAMTTSMNRVNGVYMVDVAIKMNVVAFGPQIDSTQLSSSADGFTNSNGSTMLGENITKCNAIVGSANYDIGHVFSTGGGGVAYLACVGTANKAGGVTGSPAPTADAYDIDYVAHEMGHQFGANHTFQGTTGSCGGGNKNSSTAWEPGSASTIMGYAGICGSDDLQAHSDPYFHLGSILEMITKIRSNAALGVSTNTGNTAPVIGTVSNYTIPYGTPFKLSTTATDANGDALTYCWEQYDANSALFRSFNPVSVGYRVFPKIATILAGLTTASFETLPTAARTMNFRVTVRDNRAGGGEMEYKSSVITVTGTPFSITSHNTAATYNAGGTTPVTWTVGGGSVASNVNILLSTNGGTDFDSGSPIMLAANVPNSGSYTVTLPWVNTTTARIKVEAVGNIFFDITNANVTINEPNQVTLTAPSTIIGGATGQGTITLSSPAPAGGLTFTITDTNSYLNPVASVTVPAGATSAPVSLATTNPPSNQSVFYTVGRNSWTKSSTTFTIRANTAPVANNDSYTTPYQTALNVPAAGVLTNDTDANGDALSAVLVSNPTHGTLSLNANGSFTYTPAAGYSGSDSFTYKANDTGLDSNVATVNLTVQPNPVVSGVVTLGAWAATSAGQNVTVTIRNVGSTTVLYTTTVTLNASGGYSFNKPSSYNGTYDLSFQGSHWLRKVVGNVNFGSATTTANATLINGDCSGDNVVDSVDYFILSDAYETSVGDSAYNAAADLNGDGTVDSIDYFILSDAYELNGDQ